MSQATEPEPRRRSERARSAILIATRDLLAEGGWERVTVEGIAARAHVGKQTVYRWWRSKSAILADCLLEGLILPPQTALPPSGDIRVVMTAWLRGALAYIGDPEHEGLVRGLISAAADDPELAATLYSRLTGPYESGIAARLDEARDAGELRPDLSSAEIIEMLFGMIVYRLLSRLDVRPRLADDLVSALFDGIEPN